MPKKRSFFSRILIKNAKTHTKIAILCNFNTYIFSSFSRFCVYFCVIIFYVLDEIDDFINGVNRKKKGVLKK